VWRPNRKRHSLFLRLRHIKSARRTAGTVHYVIPDIIIDSRGEMIVVEKFSSFSKNFKRVFILKSNVSTFRGNHAHMTCSQSFQVHTGEINFKVHDGFEIRTLRLNDPYKILVIPPGLWVQLELSEDCICAVYASHKYSEDDYIRDYNAFLNFKGK